MLIGRRLEIPGNEQDNPMHWWLGVTLALVLIIAAVQDAGKELFGLGVAECLTEAVSVSFVLLLIMGVKALSLFGMGLLANWNIKRLSLMVGLVLLPLACFLVFAHCEMSHALMGQKLEFKKRVTAWQHERTSKCVEASCGFVDLQAVLQERDSLLNDYGYVRIGGWRTGTGDPDCSSVYLFTAGLFADRPQEALPQHSTRGAF